MKLDRHCAPLLLILTTTLLGCSGGVSPGTTTSSNSPTPAALSTLPGDWQMEVESTTAAPAALIATFEGALAVNGATVTGTFRIPPAGFTATPCVSPTADILFTGSVDANNLLTLTSAPFSGSVAVISLQLPLSSANIGHGTVTITGGACSLASSTVLGVFVPPVTGTYAGTAAPSPILGQLPVIGGPAKLVLNQAPANADGQFPVTGTFAFNSPTCTLSTTLTGTLTGLSLNLTETPAIYPAPLLLFPILAPLNATTATRLLSFIVPVATSTCAQGNYTGQLALQ